MGVEICDAAFEATARPCSVNISVPCGLGFPAAPCVCAQFSSREKFPGGTGPLGAMWLLLPDRVLGGSLARITH